MRASAADRLEQAWVSEMIPTGTVTLLLADVEGSTRLWDSAPGEMTAAIATLDRTLSEANATYGGVRPIEQGEGDSFVVAFAQPSDAIACALELQRAPLAPVRLRIGVHTGEVQLRDEANYVGRTINRSARLRDLAHGGQTVLSGTTADLVIDRLPADVWLTDLGTHYLRDLPRPERVVQLCHPELRNHFPPLRTSSCVVTHSIPTQLTSFIGRIDELNDAAQLLADNRLITLTGAGGIGKTRLAQQLSVRLAGGFHDGVWYVDLAPVSGADLVASTVARTLGVCDQPGRSAIDSLTHAVGDRHMMIVLDNCEHVLDVSAMVARDMMAGCPRLKVLATSREPLGVAGEVIMRVPSLPIAGDAIQLFAERARLARPNFQITDDNAAAVTQLCQRLDGVPLAIELAAARMRAMSIVEILEGLHDRFRLLNRGARTAVPRQQTLRASVDWSHALLTERERVLFRRLAVFMGGFDLDAVRMVAGTGKAERHQVLNELSQLVDKSLVLTEEHRDRTRYRLLETVRQYALEKLCHSGEINTIRTRHRDYYRSLAAKFDTLTPTDVESHAEVAEIEIDNLRAAFAWCLEQADAPSALTLASFLQPFWRRRGRIQEGLRWYDAALALADTAGTTLTPAVHARALADRTMLTVSVADPGRKDAATEALELAREIGDPGLLLKALSAWCCVSSYSAEAAEEAFSEAINLARSDGDLTALSQLLPFQAFAALLAGDPMGVLQSAQEGRDIARSIGDQFTARHCCWNIGMARLCSGDLKGALHQFDEVMADADAYQDPIFSVGGRFGRSMALAFHGQTAAAVSTAAAAAEQAAELSDSLTGFTYAGLALAALAAGDVAAAEQASEAARLSLRPELRALHWNPRAEVALARGNLAAARRAADDAVSTTTGSNASRALTIRARIAAAQGQIEHARRDALRALGCASETNAYLSTPDTLECLASLVHHGGKWRDAVRLLGAAEAMRDQFGQVRFQIYDIEYQTLITSLREALGDQEFEDFWAQGAALSTEEAIAYAHRGHGTRKRPSHGWASVTPTERDVVRLVCAGLADKDVAAKLFISPRTVQTHLTHVYRKLGVHSRVQLAQEAAPYV